MKPKREYLPMLLGTLILTVFDGKRRVMHRMERRNTIQSGVLTGAPYALKIGNSAAAQFACIGIDYAMSSVAQWETGSVPTASAGGDRNETYVTHTNSYTAATSKTIRRLRMRRKGINYDAADIVQTGVLSEIGSLAITLQTNWQLETTWTLAVL